MHRINSDEMSEYPSDGVRGTSADLEKFQEDFQKDCVKALVWLFSTFDTRWLYMNHWKISIEQDDLEFYLFTTGGDIIPELEACKDKVFEYLSMVHQDFDKELPSIGAKVIYDIVDIMGDGQYNTAWFFYYRIPFEGTFPEPPRSRPFSGPPPLVSDENVDWTVECGIPLNAECERPSLVIEVIGREDDYEGHILLVAPHLPSEPAKHGEREVSERYRGGVTIWEETEFQPTYKYPFNRLSIHRYFLLVKAMAAQMIHLGEPQLQAVRQQVNTEASQTQRLPSKPQQDMFFQILREINPPAADAITRRLAWDFVRIAGLARFAGNFKRMDEAFSLVSAFLMDKRNLIAFLKETRSLEFRAALLARRAILPPQVATYLANLIWQRKKQVKPVTLCYRVGKYVSSSIYYD